jgi:hypothetical protein
MSHRANRQQLVLAEQQAKGSAAVGGSQDKYAGLSRVPRHCRGGYRLRTRASALPQGGRGLTLGMLRRASNGVGVSCEHRRLRKSASIPNVSQQAKSPAPRMTVSPTHRAGSTYPSAFSGCWLT